METTIMRLWSTLFVGFLPPMLSWTEKYSHPTSMTNLYLLAIKFTRKWSIENCLIFLFFFKYRLILQAKDMGSPPLTGTCTVRVQVVDVNDNSPTIPSMEPVTIAESMKLIYVYWYSPSIWFKEFQYVFKMLKNNKLKILFPCHLLRSSCWPHCHPSDCKWCRP